MMKMFIFFLPLAISSYFVHAYEEDDWRKLEEWYIERHPKLWDIRWNEADTLTAKQHRQICDQVLREILPSTHTMDDCHYEAPDPNKIQSERVLKYAPLKLEVRVVHITIVKCVYKEIDFFITHGDNDHVFVVYLYRYDKQFGEINYLKSGLHRVNYTV